MSVTIDHSYQLMGTAELTKLREAAMMDLAHSGDPIPEAVRLYVRTLEQRYLEMEAQRRSASCADMWDQWKR